MELIDILSMDKWAAFEKELFNRFHINCTVYNNDGVGVTGKPNMNSSHVSRSVQE